MSASRRNFTPFFRKISEVIYKTIRRDLYELEHLQHKAEGAINYAKRTLENLERVLIDECLNFDRTFGLYMSTLNGIKSLKKVEAPEYNWQIMPISNFHNLAHANQNFATSIALTDRERNVGFAMIYLPYRDILYYAESTVGAFKVEGQGNSAQKLRVSERGLKDDPIVGLSANSFSAFKEKPEAVDMRPEVTGCVLIDATNVAVGRTDMMAAQREATISCYAVELLIKEARGVVEKQICEDNMDYASIVAGNPYLMKSFEAQ